MIKKEKPKKERKKYNESNEYLLLKNNIETFKDDIFLPDYNSSLNDKIVKDNNTWFNINIYKDNNIIKIPELNEKYLIDKKEKEEKINSDKITLILNKEQQHILKLWFKCNDNMYNETIKFIKNNYLIFKEEFNNSNVIKDFFIANNKKNELYKKIKSVLNNVKSILKDKSIKKNKNVKNKNNKRDKKIEKLNTLRNIKTIKCIDILSKNIILEFELIELKKEIDEHKKKVDLFLKNKAYTMSNNKFKLNYCNIRTYFLKDKRNEIIKNCKSEIINKDIKIKTHILDCAIKIACSNYQSSITNFDNGNIKHFRIRYWKDKRSTRIIEIENCYFTKNSLCPSIFGDIKGYLKHGNKKINFNFNDIKKSCKLHYDKKTKEYLLFVPKNIINIKNTDKRNDIIGIDPGLRTFMTCLSENELIKICNIKKSRLEELINKKIKLEKIKINNIKIKKLKKSTNKRIKGLVNELHWKSIKFLTDNYKNILIGDLSTKRIVCNNNSVLKEYNKQLAYSLSFFKYRERLSYKCSIKDCNYIKVNEYYTSKTCSLCSYYKENLGSDKVYNCSNCNSILDRDVNGCRNIILKCL